MTGAWGDDMIDLDRDDFDTDRPIVAEQQGGGDRAARIRNLREEKEIGLYEAKAIVEREDLIADIGKAATIEDIKALLLRMVAA